jgi:hypothetical protein
MCRIFVTLTALISILQAHSYGQIETGKWRDHFSYNNGRYLCEGDGKVFCGTPVGVFWYKPDDGTQGKINRIHGLNDIDISAIGFSTPNSLLAIGYENGNIDLVYKDRIRNIPYVKDRSMQGSKRINNFCFYNGFAYVSTDFGIVVVDIGREEIKDTYFIGEQGASLRVNSIVVLNGRIYAATEKGLRSASVNDPLLIYYGQWALEQQFNDPNAECVDVALGNQTFYAIERTAENQKDIVWRYDGQAWSEFDRPLSMATRIRASANRVAITGSKGVKVYTGNGAQIASIDSYLFTYYYNPEMAMPVGDDQIAIADGSVGMVFGAFTDLHSVRPSGPRYNRVFSTAFRGDDLLVASGGYDAAFGNFWHPFAVFTFSGEQWSTFESGDYNDAVAIAVDPTRADEYYVSSWGGGIVQYSNGNVVERFTPANSTLYSVYPNLAYCRVSGMAFDPKGNLWVANVMSPTPINVRKADGSWRAFPYASVLNADRLSRLVYSPYGTLWLILPSGEGLFVLDPGSNIDSQEDDTYRRFKLTDRNGNQVSNYIYSLAFDREGYLWVGTAEGVVVSYNPDKVFRADEFYVQKIKVPDIVPGLAAYLLGTETVTSIAVDGGNRKWFGTSKSGVFLESSDGTKEVLHFNTTNSPIPSDNILDIAVHPKTGEVFFATDKGLVAYRGDATEPAKTFGQVYAFPNPVRPNYTGVITIAGLVENTIVKITDISGNLVYETRSQGGQATWDGCNLNGRRVSTGVYLIFCADSTGEQTAVSKLLFVN